MFVGTEVTVVLDPGVIVVKKYEEQSAVPNRVGKAEALTARRQLSAAQVVTAMAGAAA